MDKKNILVLFDIDYTLFNVLSFRKEMFLNVSRLFGQDERTFYPLVEEIYQEIRSIGYFPVEIFIERLLKKFQSSLSAQSVRAVMYDAEMMIKNIYPDTFPALQKVKEIAHIGIFSTGENEFQRAKIASLYHLLEDKFIFIAKNKKELISDISVLAGSYKTFLVDDFLYILEQTKKSEQKIVTIHIKRKEYKEQERTTFVPDAEIIDLSDVIDIIKKKD